MRSKGYAAAVLAAGLFFSGFVSAAEKNPIFSVGSEDVDEAREILKADPDAVNARDEDGSTPLHRLARIKRLLVNLNSNLRGTAEDIKEEKPSSVAVLLIEKGADVNARDKKGVAPLHWAIGREKWPLVRLLLAHDADVDAAVEKMPGLEGFTPLMLAAGRGATEIMTLLISKKADVNKTDKSGRTALHIAAQYGHVSAVKLLLKHKANTDAKNADGDTPLSVAKANKHTEVAKLLRDPALATEAYTDAPVAELPKKAVSRTGEQVNWSTVNAEMAPEKFWAEDVNNVLSSLNPTTNTVVTQRPVSEQVLDRLARHHKQVIVGFNLSDIASGYYLTYIHELSNHPSVTGWALDVGYTGDASFIEKVTGYAHNLYKKHTGLRRLPVSVLFSTVPDSTFLKQTPSVDALGLIASGLPLPVSHHLSLKPVFVIGVVKVGDGNLEDQPKSKLIQDTPKELEAVSKEVVDAIDTTIALCIKSCVSARQEISERLQNLLKHYKADIVFGMRKTGYPKVFRSGSWVIKIGDEWGLPCEFAGTTLPRVQFRDGEIGILKTKVYVKEKTKARVGEKEYVYQGGAWSNTGSVPAKQDTKQVPVIIQLHEASWITGNMLSSLQPKPDSGKQLFMLKMEIENKGKADFVLAEEGDIKMTVIRNEPSAKQEVCQAKGICINQELKWIGLPKGVKLQTKAGWVSSVSLDPKKPNIGTHHFFEVGSYKLTIESGGKIKLPVLFDLPTKADEKQLVVGGMSPMKVLPTKTKIIKGRPDGGARISLKKTRAKSVMEDKGLSGLITRIDLKNSLAEISIGSTDGIIEGMRLHVSRGDRYVCEIVIIDVNADKAVGILALTQERPRIGDRVSTDLDVNETKRPLQND